MFFIFSITKLWTQSHHLSAFFMFGTASYRLHYNKFKVSECILCALNHSSNNNIHRAPIVLNLKVFNLCIPLCIMTSSVIQNVCLNWVFFFTKWNHILLMNFVSVFHVYVFFCECASSPHQKHTYNKK